MAIRRSNRGVPVDMDALLASNQNIMAIGNMRVNAAGDVLGSRGEVIQKNEDRVRSYYKNNPQSSTTKMSLKGKMPGATDQEREDAAAYENLVKTAATEKENKRTAKNKRQTSTLTPDEPMTPDVPQPSEFDAPEEQGEPLSYREVELPNGDIEMVPVYKHDTE